MTVATKQAFLFGKGKKGPAEKSEPKKGEMKELKLSPGARKKAEANEAMTLAFKKGGPVKPKKC
jgi:hypothetical protein